MESLTDRPIGPAIVVSGVSVLLWVLLTMLLILVVAGLVAAYAAFTHRGADVPAVPWVGDVLERAVSAVPTLPGDRTQQ